MLYQAFLNTGIGLCTGIIGSFVGFTCWPWLRRQSIWKNMSVVPEPRFGTNGLWCRVVNNSSFNMSKAIAYITIDYKIEDMSDPPAGLKVVHPKHDKGVFREGQLCWAVQEAGVNPMRVDIYSGEQQPLTLGYTEDDLIVILSERHASPARVCLTRKTYSGVLKIVCIDCRAKIFKFKLNPDAEVPISLLGLSE